MLTLAAVIGVSMAAAGSASADNHGWYWSPAYMEDKITNEGLPWMKSNREVFDASCRGYGQSVVARDTGFRQYARFNCVVDDEPLGGDTSGWDTRRWQVRAFVTGHYSWRAVKVGTAAP